MTQALFITNQFDLWHQMNPIFIFFQSFVLFYLGFPFLTEKKRSLISTCSSCLVFRSIIICKSKHFAFYLHFLFASSATCRLHEPQAMYFFLKKKIYSNIVKPITSFIRGNIYHRKRKTDLIVIHFLYFFASFSSSLHCMSHHK